MTTQTHNIITLIAEGRHEEAAAYGREAVRKACALIANADGCEWTPTTMKRMRACEQAESRGSCRQTRKVDYIGAARLIAA